MATPEAGTLLDLLPDEQGRDLMSRGRHTRFPKGTRLMHENEPGDRVIVLTDGHAKSTSVTDQGQELVLGFCGPGDVLGELSFIDHARRSSSVTAIEDTEAAVLTADDFRVFLDSTPGAAITLIEMLARRFRNADRQRIEFGASDTTGRVAARLVELAQRYGEEDGGGIAITLPITQEELGAWTGSSRASAADALRTLRELGWIATERRRIVVLDIDSLRGRVG